MGHYTGEVESNGSSEIILVALWRGSAGPGAPVRNRLSYAGEITVPSTKRTDSVLSEALLSEVSKIITSSPVLPCLPVPPMILLLN